MTERYLEIATSSISRTLTVTPVSPVKLYTKSDVYLTRDDNYPFVYSNSKFYYDCPFGSFINLSFWELTVMQGKVRVH